MAQIIIGLSGKLRAGKDALAERLVKRWGFTRVSFADGLREELLERMPSTLEALHDMQMPGLHARTCDQGDREACIREMLYVTKPIGFRQLLQDYGTGVRRRDNASWWTDRWAERIADHARVVAPDVRFPNEAQAVESTHGKLWRVVRPGTVVGTHESETALDAWRWWDSVIHNDGTLAALAGHVDRLAREMGLDPAEGMPAPSWAEHAR